MTWSGISAFILPMAAANPADSFLERAPLLLRDALTGALPEPWRWFANSLIAIVATVVVFASLFAVMTLAERKILGRMQNRPGPNRTGPFGVLQPLADGETEDEPAVARLEPLPGPLVLRVLKSRNERELGRRDGHATHRMYPANARA